MAGTLYSAAVQKMLQTTNPLPMDTSTYKMILVNAAYTFVGTETTCTNLGTNEFGANGAPSGVNDATHGYQRGFGNGGRHAVALTLGTGASANIIKVQFPTPTGGTGTGLNWQTVGAATGGEVIAGIALIKEVTNDAASIPICFWPVSPTLTTNGSDITATPSANGNITFTT